ncbi:hypothetical protein ACEV6Q_23065 [Enterobacter ludwigii]|uniref:hypothetical protein n=1 Tax=Enterobacter ludwigii TaxID=299767 RepID=UPI003BEECF9B
MNQKTRQHAGTPNDQIRRYNSREDKQMIPFKWEPGTKMTFTAEHGSQVLQEGDYSLGDDGSFTMEAPGETLLLRNATSLGEQFMNINAGHLSFDVADLSGEGNAFSLTGINIGATGKTASLSVSDRPEVSEGTPPLLLTSTIVLDRDKIIGPEGTLNFTQFTPVSQGFISGICNLTGNAAFNYICSNSKYGVHCDAALTLSGSARLFIDVGTLYDISLKLSGSSAAILCCESLQKVQSIVISENAYLYCGGQGKKKFRCIAEKGTYTLMGSGATLALSGVTSDEKEIASEEGMKWLADNAIVTAMLGLNIKYDWATQSGIMLITCGF